MTTVNERNEFVFFPVGSPWNRLNDPIFSPTGYLWLPKEFVKYTATTKVRLNVRSGPSTYFVVRSTLPIGSKLTIYHVGVDALGNLWGKIGTNDWACLLYGSTSYTDWGLMSPLTKNI